MVGTETLNPPVFAIGGTMAEQKSFRERVKET